MSIGDCLSNIIGDIWAPYHSDPDFITEGPLNKISSSMGRAGKCLGRTVTLGVATALIGVALSILAKTTIGSLLGVTAFVVSAANLPLAVLIGALAAGILGTGLLTSILIEKYA